MPLAGLQKGGRHTHRLWEHLQHHIQSARCLEGGGNPGCDYHRLPRSKACQRPRGAAILTKATLEKVIEKLHEHFRASGRVGELKVRFQWWKARDDFQKLQRQLGQNMATLSLSMAGLNT